jgi:MFS family permease
MFAKTRSAKTSATVALLLLTGLNFLNYIDRNVLFAVQPLVQKEFSLTDAQVGFLTSAFFVCYMVAAPLVAPLADRYSRKRIMAAGAFVWSAATLLSAVTHSYDELLLRHVIVGIGEATFVAISPAFLADLYPEHIRGRVMGFFYLATPVGSALGYLIGGYLGDRYGWRAPFMISALPGFVLAFAVLGLREPTRGASDHLADSVERGSILGLLHNKAFWTVTLGAAMMTFAIGGLQVWMPTFLVRMRHLPLERANTVFGGMTVVSGTVATLLGGWVGDRLLRRTPAAYQLVSAVGMALSIPAVVVAIYFPGTAMYPGNLPRRIFSAAEYRSAECRAGELSQRSHSSHRAGGEYFHHPPAGRRLLADADWIHLGPQQSGDGADGDGRGCGFVGGGAVLRNEVRAEDSN